MQYFLFIYAKEVHRLQKEADDANKRSSVLERESQRCELQLGDMAQQVDKQKIKAVLHFLVSTRFSDEHDPLVSSPARCVCCSSSWKRLGEITWSTRRT